MTGTLYGVGVGPGDPELLTLKADRLIRQSPVVAYLCSRENHSMARAIARHCLEGSTSADQKEIAIAMPMQKDRTAANQVYDQAAADIQAELDQGNNVVFLCEGDPFFFGSFAYLHERLTSNYPVEIIPGITAMQASAAISGQPLAMLTEKTAVISGRHHDQEILDALAAFDNVVIMKPGSQRQRLLNLIAKADRTADGCYIEYAGHASQKIVSDLTKIAAGPGSYFSLLLLHRPRDTRQAHQSEKPDYQ